MKASEAKKILNCSYSSLHNYVKDGRLKVVRNENEHPDYINDSVYKLSEKMKGCKNTEYINIYIQNKKYEFNLSKEMISKVLDFINSELKKELNN